MTTDFFYRDLARFNAKFRELGAVVTTSDGVTCVDPATVPTALVSAYRFLLRYGAANGLLPLPEEVRS